jgi:hypothetical protein
MFSAELLPLYLHYIQNHSKRLQSLGQSELGRALMRWRERLVR